MTHVIEKRPFIGLFLLFLFYNSCLIGSGYNPKISSIEIYGNSNTLDYILEREIQHPLFSSLDSSLAEADRNRLENLGIFSDVSWKAIPLQDRTAILKFSVIESIQKTPPGAFPIYEEETGWSLTGGWIIQNFRGRNQTLQMGGSIGGKDTYGFNFSDPWMFGNHVSFSINMGRSLFNHNFLDNVNSSKPIMVAGDIKTDDLNNFKDKPFLIDVSGNLESEKGVKDINKIDKFLNTVHNISS